MKTERLRDLETKGLGEGQMGRLCLKAFISQ